jgi:hypothetical protein
MQHSNLFVAGACPLELFVMAIANPSSRDFFSLTMISSPDASMRFAHL